MRDDEFVSEQEESARIILVIGGARSGKSTFAERLALRSRQSVAYIATATAGDTDMQERIARHRAARPNSWHTVEEPLALAAAVRRAASVADVLVLDCMTLWLSNWLFARTEGEMNPTPTLDERSIEETLAAIGEMVEAIRGLPVHKSVIIVTNEVGLGVVPAYALGRFYRDLLGFVNQRLAIAATRVYVMVAGLGVDIKRLHEEAEL